MLADSLRTDPVKIAAGKAYLEAMLHPQHDRHVDAFRSFVRAYRDRAGYHMAMAFKALSNARLMRTEDGRAFIARRNAGHAEWRASRVGLPF